MRVRSKFQVNKISVVAWNPDVRIIELNAVGVDGIPENERFHRYTPCASINMTIDNPPAAAAFKVGESFYVDFTPA